MTISVTESAARQIQNQLAKRGTGVGLRVGVKKVGCSGFAYTFEHADEIRPGDQAFGAHDGKVVVDAATLSFLDGARLDYVKEGFKQVFKFDNPNIDSTCGCGESFNIKPAAKAPPQEP